MPLKRKTINLKLSGNELMASDAETGLFTSDAGIQGEDCAVWLHADIPTEWRDLSVKLQAKAQNGCFDESEAAAESENLWNEDAAVKGIFDGGDPLKVSAHSWNILSRSPSNAATIPTSVACPIKIEQGETYTFSCDVLGGDIGFISLVNSKSSYQQVFEGRIRGHIAKTFLAGDNYASVQIDAALVGGADDVILLSDIQVIKGSEEKPHTVYGSYGADLPLRQGVTAPGRILVTLQGSGENGVRKSADCKTLLIRPSGIAKNAVAHYYPLDFEKLKESVDNEVIHEITGSGGALVTKNGTSVDINVSGTGGDMLEANYIKGLGASNRNSVDHALFADDAPHATTGKKGIVQLYDGTDSSDGSLAATANAVMQVNLKAANPIEQIADGTVPGAKMQQNSIPSSALRQAGDADKIQMANLSSAVIAAMSGQSPTGTVPADGSVVTQKLANGAITDQKLGFTTDCQFAVNAGHYPEITFSGTTINVALSAGTTFYLLRRTGGSNYRTYTFTEAVTFNILHNQVLVWDLVSNKVVLQNNNDSRPDDNILLLSSHNGFAFNGKLMPYVPLRYGYAAKLGQVGFASGDAINIDLVNHVLNISSAVSVYYGQSRYYPNTAQTVDYTTTSPGGSAFGLFFDTATNSFAGRHQSLMASVPESYIQIGWVDASANVKAYINGMYTINGQYPWHYSNLPKLGQTALVSGDAIDIDLCNKVLTISKAVSIYYGQTRYYSAAEQTVNFAADNPSGAAFGLFFDTSANQFVGRHQSRIGSVPETWLQIGWVDLNATVKAYINGPYTINGLYPWQVSERPDSFEDRAAVIDGFAADQGMTVVKERIWVFRGAADDHGGFANIEVYDKNSFQKLGSMTHNLGHASNADYCPATDTVVVPAGNLTYNGKVIYPEIQLITGASSKALSGQIDYGTADVIKIPLYVLSGETLVKSPGRTGIMYAFGEAPHILYAHSLLDIKGNIDTEKTVIYKILLGMGANDYSDRDGGDPTKYGAFIPGKGDYEYNGTAKIVATYSGTYFGISQGFCRHEGHCYLAVTTENNTAEVVEIDLLENGRLKASGCFRAPAVNPDGSLPGVETEGCAVLDGRYLIAGFRKDGNEKLALFPLYNEMGGKADSGVFVKFPFQCNSAPQVMITPASDVTDLYIKTIDNTGFTVESGGGKKGSFYWNCRIS